jgi:tRNA-specific 2-thiouridylase
LPGGGPKRYVTAIDHARATVVVGDERDLYCLDQPIGAITWAHTPCSGEVMVQCSAHGASMPGRLDGTTLHWSAPQRRVAPGQSIVFYDSADRYVLGGAPAA